MVKYEQTTNKEVIDSMKKTIVRAASTAALLSIVYAGSASASTYKVQNGDNLSHIAYKYHTSVTELKALNGLKSDFLRLDQLIKLPEPLTKQTAQVKTYSVKKGDVLSKIAVHYHITVNELKN